MREAATLMTRRAPTEAGALSLLPRCGDPRVAVSEVLSFRTPQAPGPEAFPQRIGLIGDLGQTHNSSSTLEHVLQSDPPVRTLHAPSPCGGTHAMLAQEALIATMPVSAAPMLLRQ
jgi:hypothetical protein